jgi:hypothetical protein
MNNTGQVTLAHLSVKEYLFSGQLYPHSVVNIHINDRLAHQLISQTCLVCLLQLDRCDSVTSQEIAKFPLAPYAAEFWTFHAHTGGGDVLSTLQKLTVKLFQSDHLQFQNWIQLWDADDDWMRVSKSDSPLYYAALLGIQEVVQELARNKVDLNMKGGCCGNALQAASMRGHI